VRRFTALLERCDATGLVVAHVPGIPGAHAQGADEEEALEALREVLLMLAEDGELPACPEVRGLRTLAVP